MKGRSWYKIMLIAAASIVSVLLLKEVAAQKEITLEEGVATLEAKVTELEERLSKPEGPVVRKEPKRVSGSKSLISIMLVSKSFLKADPMAGDVSDRIDFIFDFISHLKKDVQAFNGALVLKDLHDQELLEVELIVEDAVKAESIFGGWRASIDYDPSLDTHHILRTIDKNDLRVELTLKEVIYTDGTREAFSNEE